MEESGQKLHPNWKALSTVHIPYISFLAEGTSASCREAVGTSRKREKSKRTIPINLSGEEIKEFYEKTIETYKSNSPNSDHKKFRTRNKTQQYLKESRLVKNQPFNIRRFFQAATENDIKSLKEIDWKSNNINVTDDFGWSALMMAACEGSKDSIQFLLENGADRNIKDKSGKTAACIANKKGYFDIVKEIKQFHCNFNEKRSGSHFKTITDDHFIYEKFFCSNCDREFEETSKKEHETSTVHKFNTKSENRKRPKFHNISDRNRGLKIMVKQGWDCDSALGPAYNKGPLYPVKTVIRKTRTGLGIEQDTAKITHFKPYDLNAIKYRPPPPKAKTGRQVRRDLQREKRRERRFRAELS